MKRVFRVELCLLVAVFVATGCATHHYHQSARPEHSEPADNDRLCREGRNQSPLEIIDVVKADLAPIELAYAGVKTTKIEHTGHEIKVWVEPGAQLKAEGRTFDLLQFHFHTPAENQLPTAVVRPLEAHFVHQSGNELAVVAVLFDAGAANAGLGDIVRAMPVKPGSQPFVVSIDSLDLLPTNRDYYRYSGSLTTSPCTEGVRWFVFKNQKSAGLDQAAALERATGKNSRPVQPLWARLIFGS